VSQSYTRISNDGLNKSGKTCTTAQLAVGIAKEYANGEPVHVFVLLISPQDRPGDHLRALENVSRSLRDDGFVRSLRQAPSREAIWDLLDTADHT